MATIDFAFQSLCKEILEKGEWYENKNRGVKRLQIPSYTLRHKFENGFPAITSKKLYFRSVATELLWFLRGDTDIEFLTTRGVTIWNKDAHNFHKQRQEMRGLTPFSKEVFDKIGRGSVGQNYSAQWRRWNGLHGQVDQILNLVNEMKADIMSSRLKVNAWNPAEIHETALPPCHSEFQVIGIPLGQDKFGFELHWNQRSVDTFLGLPFNIASYGLLAKILEKLTGFEAIGIEGTLKCVHFYDNQMNAANELMKRSPFDHANCELEIDEVLLFSTDGKSEVNVWDKDCTTSDGLDSIVYSLEPEMFRLVGYTHDKEIKVEMLAPKEL